MNPFRGYDDWKLATPPEYDEDQADDEPEPMDDPREVFARDRECQTASEVDAQSSVHYA